MKIAELFYSIQGEGKLVGVPSFFIRTSGCNLRCQWCDTPYTSWSPEGEEISIPKILEAVARESTGHTVVTGGEPMMMPSVVELTEELRRLKQHITIETAGTIWAPVICDLMSISPKMANSSPGDEHWKSIHNQRRWRPDVLKKLVARYPCQFKFVVQNRSDLKEIKEVIILLGLSVEDVCLMPEGVDPAELTERGRWIAEVCKAEGFRYSPRLHIDLWGDLRGV